MKHFALLLPAVLVICGCSVQSAEKPPLTVVNSVDLRQYLGKWYEIASYPAWFQIECTGSTAEYTLLADGRIKVVNRCFKKQLNGSLKESKGKAVVADTQTNAKLKVWFFWPFKGDYWIIDLAPDYSWAVVGTPSRKYLWILSRTPAMDRKVYEAILSRLPAKGYDPGRLNLTLQPTE